MNIKDKAIEHKNCRRVTRSQKTIRLNSLLPETPKTQRKMKRGETLFSACGSPVEVLDVNLSSRESLLPANTTGVEVLRPMLMVDGNMLNIDPTLKVKDIKEQFGQERAHELELALRKMKEETDALLSQFGFAS